MAMAGQTDMASLLSQTQSQPSSYYNMAPTYEGNALNTANPNPNLYLRQSESLVSPQQHNMVVDQMQQYGMLQSVPQSAPQISPYKQPSQPVSFAVPYPSPPPSQPMQHSRAQVSPIQTSHQNASLPMAQPISTSMQGFWPSSEITQPLSSSSHMSPNTPRYNQTPQYSPSSNLQPSPTFGQDSLVCSSGQIAMPSYGVPSNRFHGCMEIQESLSMTNCGVNMNMRTSPQYPTQTSNHPPTSQAFGQHFQQTFMHQSFPNMQQPSSHTSQSPQQPVQKSRNQRRNSNPPVSLHNQRVSNQISHIAPPKRGKPSENISSNHMVKESTRQQNRLSHGSQQTSQSSPSISAQNTARRRVSAESILADHLRQNNLLPPEEIDVHKINMKRNVNYSTAQSSPVAASTVTTIKQLLSQSQGSALSGVAGVDASSPQMRGASRGNTNSPQMRGASRGSASSPQMRGASRGNASSPQIRGVARGNTSSSQMRSVSREKVVKARGKEASVQGGQSSLKVGHMSTLTYSDNRMSSHLPGKQPLFAPNNSTEQSFFNCSTSTQQSPTASATIRWYKYPNVSPSKYQSDIEAMREDVTAPVDVPQMANTSPQITRRPVPSQNERSLNLICQPNSQTLPMEKRDQRNPTSSRPKTMNPSANITKENAELSNSPNNSASSSFSSSKTLLKLKQETFENNASSNSPDSQTKSGDNVQNQMGCHIIRHPESKIQQPNTSATSLSNGQNASQFSSSVGQKSNMKPKSSTTCQQEGENNKVKGNVSIKGKLSSQQAGKTQQRTASASQVPSKVQASSTMSVSKAILARIKSEPNTGLSAREKVFSMWKAGQVVGRDPNKGRGSGVKTQPGAESSNKEQVTVQKSAGPQKTGQAMKPCESSNNVPNSLASVKLINDTQQQQRLKPFYALFHGHKIMCMNSKFGLVLLLCQFVQDCFPDKGKGSISNCITRALRIKLRVLESPHLDKIVTFLKNNGYRQSIDKNETWIPNTITINDAKRVYHHMYNIANCKSASCVVQLENQLVDLSATVPKSQREALIREKMRRIKKEKQSDDSYGKMPKIVGDGNITKDNVNCVSVVDMNQQNTVNNSNIDDEDDDVIIVDTQENPFLLKPCANERMIGRVIKTIMGRVRSYRHKDVNYVVVADLCDILGYTDFMSCVENDNIDLYSCTSEILSFLNSLESGFSRLIFCEDSLIKERDIGSYSCEEEDAQADIICPVKRVRCKQEILEEEPECSTEKQMRLEENISKSVEKDSTENSTQISSSGLTSTVNISQESLTSISNPVLEINQSSSKIVQKVSEQQVTHDMIELEASNDVGDSELRETMNAPSMSCDSNSVRNEIQTKEVVSENTVAVQMRHKRVDGIEVIMINTGTEGISDEDSSKVLPLVDSDDEGQLIISLITEPSDYENSESDTKIITEKEIPSLGAGDLALLSKSSSCGTAENLVLVSASSSEDKNDNTEISSPLKLVSSAENEIAEKAERSLTAENCDNDSFTTPEKSNQSTAKQPNYGIHKSNDPVNPVNISAPPKSDLKQTITKNIFTIISNPYAATATASPSKVSSESNSKPLTPTFLLSHRPTNIVLQSAHSNIIKSSPTNSTSNSKECAPNLLKASDNASSTLQKQINSTTPESNNTPATTANTESAIIEKEIENETAILNRREIQTTEISVLKKTQDVDNISLHNSVQVQKSIQSPLSGETVVISSNEPEKTIPSPSTDLVAFVPEEPTTILTSKSQDRTITPSPAKSVCTSYCESQSGLSNFLQEPSSTSINVRPKIAASTVQYVADDLELLGAFSSNDRGKLFHVEYIYI